MPAWVSQSVDHGILHLKVMSSSPILGVEITFKNLNKKEEFLILYEYYFLHFFTEHSITQLNHTF